MLVISATTAAFCTKLLPEVPVPLPGVLTVNMSRSPVVRPPACRMLVGEPGTIVVAAATPTEVPPGLTVKAKLVSGKL